MMGRLIPGHGNPPGSGRYRFAAPPSKFAWPRLMRPDVNSSKPAKIPETAVSMLTPGLKAGAQAALLPEAPMAVPVPGRRPDVRRTLGRPVTGRATGHGRRAPGPGRWRPGCAGSLDAPPARRTVAGLTATTQPGSWRRGDAHLLLAEAFIIAVGKPGPLPAGQHAADATAAGLALVEFLDSPQTLISTVCCSPQQSFNLLTAMALWAGLRIDPSELRAELLVVAARPQPKPSAPTASAG